MCCLFLEKDPILFQGEHHRKERGLKKRVICLLLHNAVQILAGPEWKQVPFDFSSYKVLTT